MQASNTMEDVTEEQDEEEEFRDEELPEEEWFNMPPSKMQGGFLF